MPENEAKITPKTSANTKNFLGTIRVKVALSGLLFNVAHFLLVSTKIMFLN